MDRKRKLADKNRRYLSDSVWRFYVTVQIIWYRCDWLWESYHKTSSVRCWNSRWEFSWWGHRFWQRGYCKEFNIILISGWFRWQGKNPSCISAVLHGQQRSTPDHWWDTCKRRRSSQIKWVCSDPDQRYTPKYGDSGNDPSVDGARHLNGWGDRHRI